MSARRGSSTVGGRRAQWVTRGRAGGGGRSTGVASSRARFAARAAGVRRRPWLLAGWSLGIVGLLAGLAWLVWFSPVLAARTVRIQGVPAAAVADITARAQVPLGQPLARVDTRAIARRVIASATLAEVTVSRSWPSTVVITASPRVPVLAVKNPQGQVQVVDADGIAYATVPAAPRGVPQIRTDVTPPSREALRAGISVLQALTPAQRRQVTDVRVTGASSVSLTLGRRTVVWGGASDPELKVKVLSVLLRQNASLIDVSTPGTPVIR
ncbi:cell division protein FtsQ/DivIB [Oryzihumus sp.]